MRSLALSVLCLTPSFLVSACGDNHPPAVDDNGITDPGDTGVDTDVDTGESGSDPMTPREIAASLDIQSPSCDAATASYEALVHYAGSTTSVPNVRCRITFDDGAVADQCAGEHTFASAGAHMFTLEVEDLDTHAVARTVTTRTVAMPLEVELTIDAPDCGLELAFDAKLSTRAEVHVTMSPADKVVAPHVVGTTGSFQVLEPGTYTISLSAEVERPTGPICVREISRTVELLACCPQ